MPKEPIKRFTDIIDKDKMIEQLKKSGKVQVKLTFHYPNKTKTIKAYLYYHLRWWCDSKQTILHFEQLVRKSFAIPETEGLFFYIDTKMPDKSTTFITKLKL